MSVDRAGKAYWTRTWRESPLPAPLVLEGRHLVNYPDRELNRYFTDLLSRHDIEYKTLLEVGCGRSVWLPHFARQFGVTVTGLDYSPVGCEQARAILAAQGVSGEIVCADLFSPPPPLLGSFDVVFSYGLVEHFEDTIACVRALSRFLRPNGWLVTVIPNMAGLVGRLQRSLNRPVYDLHVPLDREDLRTAHERAGLVGVEARHLVPASFGICTLNGLPTRSGTWWLKKLIIAVGARLSRGLWLLDDRVVRLPIGRRMSSYVACAGQRAAPEAERSTRST